MRRVVFLLAAVLALVGCGGGGDIALRTQGTRYTQIDWLGNQCFRITSPLGTSILANPFASKTGGRTLPSPLKSDIVLITAERPEFNNINAIDNQPAVLRGGVGIGVNNVTGIQIRGIPFYEDPEMPASAGMNMLFTWVMDGIRYCFAGSLERPLDADQLMQVGAVDVLFLDPGNLSSVAREEIILQLRPRLVIPMGRSARGWNIGQLRSAVGSRYSLNRQMLPLQTSTLVFNQ